MIAPTVTAPEGPRPLAAMLRGLQAIGRMLRAVRRFHRWPTPHEGRMTKVCSWCDTVLEWGGPQRTHTICAACVEKHFPAVRA